MTTEQRFGVIDFWRGLLLVVILVDHIPGNWLEGFTPRNYGLSDSAEAFVFLSGLVVGLVYYKKTLQVGMAEVVRRCFGRACRIYGVHIGVTCCAVAIFAFAYGVNALPALIEEHGRGFVFHDPWRGLVGILLLSQQLGYFNILPMYVLLMLWSPFVLAMARASLGLALGVAIIIYMAARLAGLALPNWPESGTWFFNPFAWQLLFTLGIVAGIQWRAKPIAFSPVAVSGSVAVVAAAAMIATNAMGMGKGLHDAAFLQLDILKQNLGLVRLLHFMALAYLIAQVPFLSTLAGTVVGKELQRLGRHSLAVFALGSLLCALGQAVMQLAETRFDAGDEVIGILYTVFGVAGLFLWARYLEWAKPRAVRQSSVTGASSADALPASLHVSASRPPRVSVPRP